MVVTPSALGYPETVARLSEGLERRKLTLFARIDHAGAARKIDMELADEEAFVFDPRDLAGRYQVAAGAPTLEAMSQLLEELAREAASDSTDG